MQAEADLAERERRVRRLDIHPHSAAARIRYTAQWQAIQEQFVDAPQTAVTEAYALVTSVMRERGYPLGDDEQVTENLSVDHARTGVTVPARRRKDSLAQVLGADAPVRTWSRRAPPGGASRGPATPFGGSMLGGPVR